MIQTITKIVEAALLAPSGDNCQPWRFVWKEPTLEIHFIFERAKAFIDVQSVASWVALGAMLTNMRIASDHHGFQIQSRVFERGSEANPVAAIEFKPAPPKTPPLFPALQKRCTNRRAYETTPLTPDLRAELNSLVHAVPGTSLDLVEDRNDLEQIASRTAEFDRLLFQHSGIHETLFKWIRWTPDEAQRTRDGMPLGALELNLLDRIPFGWLRHWPLAAMMDKLGASKLACRRSQRQYRRSGAFALLGMEGLSPMDFVRGGEIFESLWLTIIQHGYSLQPVTGFGFLILRQKLTQGEGLTPEQIKWVDRFVNDLHHVLPGLKKTPVMMFRLGKATPPSARTLRLPVEKVLTLS